MFMDVYINYLLLLTQSSKKGAEKSFNSFSFALDLPSSPLFSDRKHHRRLNVALGILRKFHSPNLHPRMDFFHHTTWFSRLPVDMLVCVVHACIRACHKGLGRLSV